MKQVSHEAGNTIVEWRMLKCRKVSNLSKMIQAHQIPKLAVYPVHIKRDISLPGLSWRLNELMYGKHPEQCLEHISNAYIFAVFITLLFLGVDGKGLFIDFFLYATFSRKDIVIKREEEETIPL